MATRTQVFAQLPWVGGLNTAVDESMIPPNQLTVADNLIFDTRGSRKKRDGINFNWDASTAGTASIIGLHDFWFGTSTRSQRLVGVTSTGTVYSYNGGTRTTITDGGTAYSGTLTTCVMKTFFNKLIIAVSGTGNVLKEWDGSGNLANVAGTPPDADIITEHVGRLVTNDKTARDRVHYSPVGDRTQWLGIGDSGALDIGVGDGDPSGITGMVSFKGDLFVFKRTKMYRVSGQTPEDMTIQLVSSGIGCISHNSIVTVDQDDVFFMSEKGIHSLQAVAAYGDFSSNDVSADIQTTFNGLNKSRLKFAWGAYLPNINSVAFAVAGSGIAYNDRIYLYNIPTKSWYRWPNIACESLVVANDVDKKRFYIGGKTTRVAKAFNGTNYDITSAGTHVAVAFRVTTGQMFPDGNAYSMKAIKRFIIFYRPKGTHTLTVTVRIDNTQLSTENQLSFSEVGASGILGSSFTLGSSVLGYEVVLSPYSRMVDGVGRAVKIDISQNDVDSEVEIQGFAIEYESAGTSPEVFLR